MNGWQGKRVMQFPDAFIGIDPAHGETGVAVWFTDDETGKNSWSLFACHNTRDLQDLLFSKEALYGYRFDSVILTIETYNRLPRFLTSLNASRKYERAVKELWPWHTSVLRVMPASWRKAELGNGKLNTEQAKKIACRVATHIVGHQVENHNIAEAVCICRYGLKRWEMLKGDTK